MSFYVNKYYRKGEFAKTEAVSRVLRTLQEESDVILKLTVSKKDAAALDVLHHGNLQ